MDGQNQKRLTLDNIIKRIGLYTGTERNGKKKGMQLIGDIREKKEKYGKVKDREDWK